MERWAATRKRPVAAVPTYLQTIVKCVQSADEASTASSRGSFCTSHLFSLLQLPLIHVDGVGQLSYPLSPPLCRALIGQARLAPFGRGTRTLVDVRVRNTFEVEAARITVDEGWTDTLRRVILPQLCADLGLRLSSFTSSSRPVDVQYVLYKLLVYESGGFFAPHRDSEKDAGMFGTLVVLLPSEHSGGELHITHQGETRVLDMAAQQAWRSFAYAAFYADCQHEIKPVTSGYRVALTYNLCWTSSAASPTQLPTAQARAEEPAIHNTLSAALAEWSSAAPGPSALSHLVVPLEHRYTELNLAPDRLKAKDKALLRFVTQAVQGAHSHSHSHPHPYPQSQAASSSDSSPAGPVLPPILVFLGQLDCHVRFDRDMEDEEEEDEDEDANRKTTVTVSRLQLVPVQSGTGAQLALYSSLLAAAGSRGVRKEHIVHTDATGREWLHYTPSNEEEEDTGNEGTMVDRFYTQAAIVLVVSSQRWAFAVYFPGEHPDPRQALIRRLHDAARESGSDVQECIALAQALGTTLDRPDSEPLYPSYLLAIAALRETVKRASPAIRSLLATLSSTAWGRCNFELDSASLPDQLDGLLQKCDKEDVDLLAARLVDAFRRRLASSATAARSYFSLVDPETEWRRAIHTGAGFLLRVCHRSEGSSSHPGVLHVEQQRRIASADVQQVSQRWEPLLRVMLEALCEQLSLVQLNKLRTNLNAALETGLPLLRLFAALLRQPAQLRSRLSQTVLTATKHVATVLAEVMDAAWEKVQDESKQASRVHTADVDFMSQIDNKLVKPLLPALQQLKKAAGEQPQQDPHPRAAFIATCHPLLLRIQLRLTDQLEAATNMSQSLPHKKGVKNWAYPLRVTLMFPLQGASSSAAWCGCTDCAATRTFLADSEQQTWNVSGLTAHLSHVEHTVRALCNPQLVCATARVPRARKGTLTVTKKRMLGALVKEWSKRVQDDLTAVEQLMPAESATSSTTRSRSSAAPPPATVSESAEASGAAGDTVIHYEVSCDYCHVSPIVGVRYKCLVCSNYDLCPVCRQRKPSVHTASHDMRALLTPISSSQSMWMDHDHSARSSSQWKTEPGPSHKRRRDVIELDDEDEEEYDY